ncbi:pyrimidine 5'-nucleotidase [Aliidongia dinghuensis]|uniref:Pyrimidine 5'-nucleotidase n=1 Tax=Aliidongia dinghuensis TaxID=1867774 RepID=A0A8J2YS49_9PROT|nr:pyrimidine 5'-nucleotidase [Aliidongia dinghuensis]GGF08779.1 pyrimidine 5'-nucleotidase [Aliidongia dinghuensis]
MPLPPHEIEAWVFDLDNTLYPAGSNLFAQIAERMSEYIMRLLGVDAEAALAERKRLFQAYGTTMRGLMTEHAIDPHSFLAHVHDIDLTVIEPAPALDAALDGLSGRKLVFTNGSVRHAERVLERLGIARHFEVLFDIAAAEFQPKPHPSGYQKLIDLHAVVPARAAMVEDMARNLEPAAALGMLTLWVRSPLDWQREGADEPYVHYQTDDLTGWLETHGRGSGAAPDRGGPASRPG